MFRTVATTPDELRSERVRQPDVTVVCEACSQAGWGYDLGEELGLHTTMASTTVEAWQWKRVKRKTDMKKDEAEYAEQVRVRQDKNLHRRVRELGYELVPIATPTPDPPTAA